MNTHSMAAAHSALIEMQNQGLSYQNIEELVQNIQNLLNCLRVCPFPYPPAFEPLNCVRAAYKLACARYILSSQPTPPV